MDFVLANDITEVGAVFLDKDSLEAVEGVRLPVQGHEDCGVFGLVDLFEQEHLLFLVPSNHSELDLAPNHLQLFRQMAVPLLPLPHVQKHFSRIEPYWFRFKTAFALHLLQQRLYSVVLCPNAIRGEFVGSVEGCDSQVGGGFYVIVVHPLLQHLFVAELSLTLSPFDTHFVLAYVQPREMLYWTLVVAGTRLLTVFPEVF